MILTLPAAYLWHLHINMDNIIGLTLLRVTGGSAKKDYPGNIWRMKLLLASLQKYLQCPLDLHVVCPADELETTRALFTSSSNVNLIWESAETYLPGIGASPANPWLKAQALMFAFGAQQTKHVLKLDADELLVRPMRENHLWNDGKSGISLVPFSSRMIFWQPSADLLNIPLDLVSSGFQVQPNPFMMSPVICQNLITHIIALGKTLLGITEEEGWIDFALYTLIAAATCGMSSQHFACKLGGPNIARANESTGLRDRTSFISTIQSFVGFTETQTKAMIAEAGILSF